jgi:hypothetical protein
LSQELATKFELKLLESGLGLGRKTASKSKEKVGFSMEFLFEIQKKIKKF